MLECDICLGEMTRGEPHYCPPVDDMHDEGYPDHRWA